MSKEFDDEEIKNEKNKLGNTLDYYNDEVSRKVVGKLVSGIDDYEDTVKPPEIDTVTPKTDKNRDEEPISTHFYEDSRVNLEEQMGDNIVTGFRKKEVTGKTEYDDEPITGNSERAERDRYRRQFLDGYETDARRTGLDKRSVTEPTRRSGTARNNDLAPLQRDRVNRSEKIERKPRADEDDSLERVNGKREVDTAHRAGSSPARKDYKLQQTPERKSSTRSSYANRDNGNENVSRRPERKRELNTSRSTVSFSSLAEAPVFKIIGGVFVIMLLVMIFLVMKINNANKEIKTLTEEAAVSTEAESLVSTLQTENDSLKQQVNALITEKNALAFRVTELEGNAVPEENQEQAGEEAGASAAGTASASSHTVETGDTLYGISLKYYNNVSRVQDIMDANSMTDASKLSVGQVIKLP